MQRSQLAIERRAIRATFTVFSLFAMLMHFGAAAWASSTDDKQSITITLSVNDDENRTAGQALIEVLVGSQVMASGETGGTGKLSLVVHGADTYKVRVSKAGYITAEIALRPGVATQAVNVVMTHAPVNQEHIEVQATAVNPVTEQTASSQKTWTRPKRNRLRESLRLSKTPCRSSLVSYVEKTAP